MPRLRVNLLLARRIYQSGLKGSFNKEYIFFKLYKERVIEATIRNRLYIIIYVVDGYYDKAFTVFLANNKDIGVKSFLLELFLVLYKYDLLSALIAYLIVS